MKSQRTQKDLFIHYAFGHSLLLALSASYVQLGNELASLDELLHELKSRRGERLLDGKSAGTALELERERAYEVATLRVKLACGSLMPAIRELQQAVAVVDTELSLAKGLGVIEKLQQAAEATDCSRTGEEFGVLLNVSVAQNNMLCARELVEVATALYYDTVHKQVNSSNSAAVSAIERIYEQKKEQPNARVFVIKCNYNDSLYRYDGGDGSVPPEGPHMTLEEARDAASNWIGYSNGVGDAVIQNLATGQFYTFDGRPVKGEF